MKRTGSADLPLHYGKAPRWLFERMVLLSREIGSALVYEYGQREFLRRVSDPCWFQALSCVLGFDWHSSGTTTTTCAALKLALGREELGIAVAGGKGKTSKRAPEEIEKIGEGFSLSDAKIAELRRSSILSAKVDNACVQDSYQLYHHCFFLSEKGEWAVVQQGMNDNYARRYHWLSEGVESFVSEPHSGICTQRFEERVLDLTARASEETRKASLDLVRDGPEKIGKYVKPAGQMLLNEYASENLILPSHHPVLDVDIGARGMEILRRAYELQPANYEELVALRGMGPKKLRALALISDLLYGTKPSWNDPAKFSFAHGGKDGFPYPVDRETYDSSIAMLKDAVMGAKIGDQFVSDKWSIRAKRELESEKYRALRRLKDFVE
ncbi:MAG: DUF763 domain-containing protein [Candidatus Micrarchaeota archaeon]